jgi:hypothetical protein
MQGRWQEDAGRNKDGQARCGREAQRCDKG